MPSANGAPDIDVSAAIALLRQWLVRSLPAEAVLWLDTEINRQRDAADERRLGTAIGLVGRRVGRGDLLLTPDDITAAHILREGWQPDAWGTDEAARAAILLASRAGDDSGFAARLERLCITGELNEHVACLKAFAILPASDRLLALARDAVRSSVQPVFEAIACRNPYPATHFDEAAFNQMVVKCVFSGVPLASITGLDARRNAELMRMLRDLISERHAAGRTVPASVLGFAGTKS